MTKISSNMTFVLKILFPVFWFGILAIFITIGGGVSILEGFVLESIPFVLFPIIMGVFGYFFMKKFIFELANEVYDEGLTLLIKKSGKEVRVPLSDIKNVSYMSMSSPPRATLSLRTDTTLGKEISFMPKTTFIPFKEHASIKDLIDRVDKARGY